MGQPYRVGGINVLRVSAADSPGLVTDLSSERVLLSLPSFRRALCVHSTCTPLGIVVGADTEYALTLNIVD